MLEVSKRIKSLVYLSLNQEALCGGKINRTVKISAAEFTNASPCWMSSTHATIDSGRGNTIADGYPVYFYVCQVGKN
jgi:hypothetical protein